MTKMDKVTLRQSAIKELIKSHPIKNQTTLVQMLHEKYDIDTNQSIISRDLQDLGVGKQKYKNTMVYELKEVDASKEILRLGVRDVVHNENLIIVKTLPGLAAFVGDYLDLHEDIGVLGTLAGENMVFVSPRSIKDTKAVYKAVCERLYFKLQDEIP